MRLEPVNKCQTQLNIPILITRMRTMVTIILTMNPVVR